MEDADSFCRVVTVKHMKLWTTQLLVKHGAHPRCSLPRIVTAATQTLGCRAPASAFAGGRPAPGAVLQRRRTRWGSCHRRRTTATHCTCCWSRRRRRTRRLSAVHWCCRLPAPRPCMAADWYLVPTVKIATRPSCLLMKTRRRCYWMGTGLSAICR